MPDADLLQNRNCSIQQAEKECLKETFSEIATAQSNRQKWNA